MSEIKMQNTYTKLNTIAKNKKAQFKALQDEFTSFSWGGVDAWDAFGAFIINDKRGSLKFYNGPGFSNEYTKPQFDLGGGQLQGVNFNKQTISFTIGVYWFSIEDYRKLLYWLNPMKIDYLTFGFNPKYRYDVKLSNISDSTKWVIGKENGENRYYTELSLTFELQGTPCAKGIHPYEFKRETNNDSDKDYWIFTGEDGGIRSEVVLVKTNEMIKSDLETPVKISFKLNLQRDEFQSNPEDSIKYHITLKAIHGSESISLVELGLQNLTLFEDEDKSLSFTYYSETGLVFLETSDNIPSLLSLQTYADTKDFLVETLYTSKFMLPGEFQYPGFYNDDNDDNKTAFELYIQKYYLNEGTWQIVSFSGDNGYKSDVHKQLINIECYPRTNIS